MNTIKEIGIKAEISDYEIERGKPMPSKNHAIIQDNISFELNTLYRKNYKILPEISIDTPEIGSVPDIAIYPKLSLDVRHDETRLSYPPLVTIEILSPNQKLQDLIDKTDRYFEFGVKSCWLVLPSLKTVILYTAINTFEYIRGNAKLRDPNTGFELDLGKVFE